MEEIPDNRWDFVHSSHCLEHMVDPYVALKNWIRITETRGYLIITVPDEDMYERGDWPSKRNPDHKHTFTIGKESSWSPVSINVIDMLMEFIEVVEIIRITKLDSFFSETSDEFDQTMNPVAECGIEFVLRKR